MGDNLIRFNWTVDNVNQGDKILFRYDDNLLTEASIISNHKDIPEPRGSIRYDTMLLDTFVGLNVKDWDGHSPMTTYLRRSKDVEVDHSEKTTSAATAGASV